MSKLIGFTGILLLLCFIGESPDCAGIYQTRTALGRAHTSNKTAEPANNITVKQTPGNTQ